MMVFIRLLGKNIILWMICNRKKEMKKEKNAHKLCKDPKCMT